MQRFQSVTFEGYKTMHGQLNLGSFHDRFSNIAYFSINTNICLWNMSIATMGNNYSKVMNCDHGNNAKIFYFYKNIWYFVLTLISFDVNG